MLSQELKKVKRLKKGETGTEVSVPKSGEQREMAFGGFEQSRATLK